MGEIQGERMELDWRDSAKRKKWDEEELLRTDAWNTPGGGSKRIQLDELGENETSIKGVETCLLPEIQKVTSCPQK